MFDTNNVAIVGALALAVAAFTIGSSDSGPDIVENYGDLPSFTTRAVPSYSTSRSAAQKGQIFAAPPSMQAMISPRFNSGSLPATITYSPPSTANMAYKTTSPFADNAAAGRSMQTALGRNRCTNSGMTGNVIEGFNGADNSTMVVNSAQPSLLPGSAAALGMEDSQANPENPVVFDRYITANRTSRLRAQGDKIRGDLAIPPCNSGWFQVSVTPSIDLEQGALAVMGGTFNQQGQNLASLVNMSSGGTTTAISGVDMSTSINTCLAGAGNDVTSIAFA